MKAFIYKYTLLILLVSVISSCDDSFLDRTPLDALSEETFFNTANDLQTFVNGFYGQLRFYPFGGGDQLVLELDANSDIVIHGNTITNSLDKLGSSGLAPVTSSDWNNRYVNIRPINYFLSHYGKVMRDAVSNQFIGEGYFFRAWNYFSFLASYGDLPYITDPLNTDNQELFREKDPRNIVAKLIVQDLDSAIANLSWKGEGEARPGRINKESAIVMKARVALFEGTWEYYHGLKGSKFRVSGKNGIEFLELVAPAVQELIDHQGANIFTAGGLLNEPYNQLFAQYNCENTAGVFWYRQYTPTLLARSNDFYTKVNDTGASITKRLVDMYLDRDGKPQGVSSMQLSNLNELGQNLDPRFRQTIWTPDRGPMTGLPGRINQQDLSLRYPLITPITADGFTSTGLRNWKGAVLDATQYRAGETDDVFIRYAEALLAYAEAKAILGTITQADLDKTVNLIRGRVNMTPMILSDISSWVIAYDISEGFDPSEENIVNEIRRERTVELALEGFRLDDLKRWAVFENVINGYKPKGAKLNEFIDYFNDPSALAADGWAGSADLELITGINVDMDDQGNINPYFKSTQFQEGGAGFFIDKDRDYLNPIPVSEIDLYSQSGVTLTQNPGWN